MSNLVAMTVADICHHLGATAHIGANNQNQALYPIAEDWYNKAMKIYIFHGGHDREILQKRYDLHWNLMNVCNMQRKYPEAIEHATMAQKSNRKLPIEARYFRALTKLMMNNYEEGFKEFECRWDADGLHKHCQIKDIPRWEGQKCKSLHVYAEQGFGDVVMFSRYVPMIKKRFQVEKIFWEVLPVIAGLFKYNFRNHPDIEVISSREGLQFDYTVQSMSLPHLFGTTFATVPEIKIEAEPEYVEKWKFLDHKYIAICAGGRPDVGDWRAQEWNSRRNIDAQKIMECLGSNPAVSLQKEFNPQIENWSDTAGIIANSKMVISIDSGPVHLAAAMNICPVMLLNHYQSCWRWTVDKSVTPWYPDLIINRQEREGEWQPVLDRLKNYVIAS